MGVTLRSNVNIDSGEYRQITDYLYTKMSMAVQSGMWVVTIISTIITSNGERSSMMGINIRTMIG